MLVLSRKKGESIIIGDSIEVVVLETSGESVRLGIRAPKNIEVYRKEVFDSIQQENKNAMRSTVNPLDLKGLFGNDKRE